FAVERIGHRPPPGRFDRPPAVGRDDELHPDLVEALPDQPPGRGADVAEVQVGRRGDGQKLGRGHSAPVWLRPVSSPPASLEGLGASRIHPRQQTVDPSEHTHRRRETTMFRAVRVAGALTLAAIYLALAGPANAATVTMTGETLNTAPLASTVTVHCGATSADTSTVEYFATGAAVGPYPGTFTEHGILTFHGNTADSYSAEFTIISGGTTIAGTKHLAPVSQSVSCGPFPPFVDGASVVLT